jgi:hypothetical protein
VERPQRLRIAVQQRFAQRQVTANRQVATSFGGPVGFRQSGGLGVGLRVREHLGREGEHGVARLGQAAVLHEDGDAQAAALHHPVDGPRREPRDHIGFERRLGVPGGAQRLDGASPGRDDVGLGAGEVDVRAATEDTIFGFPFVGA